MLSLHLNKIGVVLSLLLMGCTAPAPKPDNPLTPQNVLAEQKLTSGIANYEEGDYKASQTALQAALDAGLTNKSDQVRAHKYLAFIHCVSGREKQCRDAFKKALDTDPSFDLKPAEAGHPIWGPVFRAVATKSAK
jgi:Tfp pilus assembly protein PilF